MKFTIDRDSLMKPLQQVAGVVERRQTLPILSNILLTIKNNQLSMIGTDLEVEMQTHASLVGAEQGEITVPARKLLDICRALPDQASIQFSLTENRMVIRSGKSRFVLSTLPAAEFPNIEVNDNILSFSISQSILKNAIERSYFAMAQQDVRYYLNGMLLEVRPGRIRTVATDGHRLALCDESFDPDSTLDIQVILPRKAVLELSRLLSDSDDLVKLELSSSHVRITLAKASFTSKLIDGRFPDYERVMPTGEPQVVTADKDALRQSLTRTAILSNEKYRGIRFRLSPGLLSLQAHNPEQDEAEEEVEIDYAGDEMTIGFNVGYLLDVLGTIDSDDVKIAVADANSSSLITNANSDGCRYVIMPMRL